VLTHLKIINDISEIVVGVHGIYIERSSRSGLLLPQVAMEHQWDARTFIEETCYKAGLSPDAWKDKDARIYIFSSDVFSRCWQDHLTKA